MTHALFRLVSTFALLCTIALPTPVTAQTADGDADGDGVADSVDLCDDTPAGDLVDADGCSVCPCDAPNDADAWTSHDAYVACVSQEAHGRRAARTISRRAMRAAIRAARKSSCGNAELTRCCVYPHLDDTADFTVGQCRIMTVDACATLSDNPDLDYVEDIDGGSCTPNPCQF